MLSAVVKRSLRFMPLAAVLFIAGCASPPPPMIPAHNPQSAVEICAGGECGKAGEKFALDDIARAIAKMFNVNGPGVWDFCLADRGDKRCIQDKLTYTVHGAIPATGSVPGGALRAGAQYDGKRGVNFRVNIPTIVFDVSSVCDDARSTLSVRSSKNIIWTSNPYMCSWGGGPKTIKAEGRYGIDYIDFDRGIMGGEFVIRVSEGGNGFTKGYAVTRLSTGMDEVSDVWLGPKGVSVASGVSSFNPQQAMTRPRVAAALPSPAVSAGFPEAPIDVTFRRGLPRPDDIAVIIGNADYSKGRDIPNVNPAYADANGIKRYVTQSLGISDENIIFLKDATQAEMTSTFGSETNPNGQLFNYVKPGISRIFVYYSGHGAPGGKDGASYIVPTDAQASTIELNGYSLKTLYRNLSKIPAKSITVVLEACFSGASQSGTVISNASPIYLKAKETGVPPKITLIAAGAANQIASWEQDKSSGLFTEYFLKGMSGEADAEPYGNGDGKVEYDELGRYLKGTMSYFARRYYGREQTVQIVVGGS